MMFPETDDKAEAMAVRLSGIIEGIDFSLDNHTSDQAMLELMQFLVEMYAEGYRAGMIDEIMEQKNHLRSLPSH